MNRRLSAVVIAFLSLHFMFCLTFAEDLKTPVYVDAREQDQQITVGNVNAQQFGVHIQAGNGHKAVVSAENITAKLLENFPNAALYVSVNGGGSLADVKTKDLTAEKESENYGANINAVNGGHAVIRTGKISGWTGVQVNAEGKNSSVRINTGDIHAVQYGLMFQSNDHAEIDISAGNIVSVMEGIFNPFYAMAGNGGKVRVTAKDITCEHEFGVSGFASGTDSELTIKTNDIRTEYIGMNLSTENGAKVYAEAGDVTIINTDTGPYSPAISRRGIGGNSGGDGSFLEFRINGSVFLSEFGNNTEGNLNQMPSEGILASSSGNGNTFIQIEKNIEVKAEKTQTVVSGIRAENSGGTVTVSAGSDVSAEVPGSQKAYGLYITGDTSPANEIDDPGNPEDPDRSPVIPEETSEKAINGSRTDITIHGDLSGSAYGLYLEPSEDIKADVLVTGTISGKTAGVLTRKSTSPENFSLTAWAIRLNADGNAVVNADGSAAPDIEKTVKYIIKTEPGSQGKVILSDENGDPLEKVNGYSAAVQGKKVFLRAAAGYSITAANCSGEVLDRDSEGRFFLIVPKGGGVMLSVETREAINFYRILDREGRLPDTGFSARTVTPLRLHPQALLYGSTGLTLQIPSLDVMEPIVNVPKPEEGYRVDWLGSDIGLLDGTALPGKGVSVLTGHNHLNTTEAGPFLFLSTLEENDLILVTDENGNSQKFHVSGNYLIAPDGLNSLSDELTENTLILITCENESPTGGYFHRRVILAVP